MGALLVLGALLPRSHIFVHPAGIHLAGKKIHAGGQTLAAGKVSIP